MSKFVENVYLIQNNTFVFYPLFISFYRNIFNQPKNILLSYLVLPMILNETSRRSVKYSKSTSSIYTFVNKKENVIGLPRRIKEYKEITNTSIQYCVDNNYLRINNDLSISANIDTNINVINQLKELERITCKLNNIFQQMDIPSVYKLLGVKEL